MARKWGTNRPTRVVVFGYDWWHMVTSSKNAVHHQRSFEATKGTTFIESWRTYPPETGAIARGQMSFSQRIHCQSAQPFSPETKSDSPVAEIDGVTVRCWSLWTSWLALCVCVDSSVYWICNVCSLFPPRELPGGDWLISGKTLCFRPRNHDPPLKC